MLTHTKKRSASLLRLKIDTVTADFRHGIHRSAMTGSGIDFRMVRAYDPADPPSRIDWLASARLSDDDTTFVVREYHPDREIGVLCAIDMGSTMEHPRRKREYGDELMWLFALSAFRSHDRFELVYFDPHVVKSSGWGRTEDWLTETSLSEEQIDLVSYIEASQLANTLLVVISDFNETGYEHMRRFRMLDLGSQNVQSVFLVLDEWAGFAPVRFRVAFFDALSKRSRVLSLGRGGGAWREAERQRKYFEELYRIVRPLGIPCITIPLITENPLDLVCQEFLKLGFE